MFLPRRTTHNFARTFRTAFVGLYIPKCTPFTSPKQTMATASKVELSTADAGIFHVAGISSDSARKGSEVLQENHDKHHAFYNESGFHSRSSIQRH
jgi:hypothetical protein